MENPCSRAAPGGWQGCDQVSKVMLLVPSPASSPSLSQMLLCHETCTANSVSASAPLRMYFAKRGSWSYEASGSGHCKNERPGSVVTANHSSTTV